MKNKLKPVQCGCGGKPIIYINGAFQVKIYCEKCGIETYVFNSEEEAIQAWNKAMGERTAKVYNFETIGKFTFGSCGACSAPVAVGDNYCNQCGARLEWE